MTNANNAVVEVKVLSAPSFFRIVVNSEHLVDIDRHRAAKGDYLSAAGDLGSDDFFSIGRLSGIFGTTCWLWQLLLDAKQITPRDINETPLYFHRSEIVNFFKRILNTQSL